MFLLDTNVISELRKARMAEPKVVAWANAADASALFISVITVLELEQGVLRIERRDARQGMALRSWLDGQVMPAFSARILPIDADIARRCAGLHVPDPRSERDALIAATALVHGLTIVTLNVMDFHKTGVRLVNPWD
jgi:predicted nucleic acid-binding protein